MDRSKTRIWREGIAGFERDRNEPPAEPQRRSLPPPPPPPRANALGRTWRSSLPPPPLPKLPLLQTTRIHPIETLLPPPLPAPAAPSGDAPAPTPRAPKRTRFAVHGLLGLATLFAVAAWQVPRLLSARPGPVSKLEPAREGTPVDPATLATAPREQAPSAPPPGPLPSAQRAELQRAAVDAVIAGDYAHARRAYRELAAAEPETRAFREAIRMLELRERAR